MEKIEMTNKEEKLKQLILNELPKDPHWIQTEFEEILDDEDIRRQLKDAYVETCKVNWINRHGTLHGLTTTYNSLRLFKKLIYDGIVDSSYEKYFGVKKPLILFSLLVASYIHDAGRAYIPQIERIKTHGERLEDVVERLEKLKGVRILRSVSDLEKPYFFRIVRELCLCHDMKEEESERAEIAIIKLADALDCDKERAYSEEDKEELKDKSDLEKMDIVLKNDKHPECYWGCQGIESVSIDWNDYENSYDVTLTVTDYAAVIAIKNIIGILKICGQSREEPVKKLARRIRVMAKKDNTVVFLHPENPQAIESLLNIKALQRSVEFDILNEKGDATITSYLTVKNEREHAGLKGIFSAMWGHTPASVEDLKFTSHQLIDDRWEELDVEHRFLTNGGREHWWTIILKDKLKIDDEPVKIRSTLSGWKGLVKIEADEGAYFVVIPHELLELKVLFPRKIKKELIRSSFEIRSGKDPKSQKVYTETLDTSHAPTADKHLFTKCIEQPATGYIYSIKWNLLNTT